MIVFIAKHDHVSTKTYGIACMFTIPKHMMFILNDMSLVMSTLRACYDDYVNIYLQCHIARVYNKEGGRVSYSLYPSVVAVVPRL